jgi:hypothetical protein
MDSLQTITDGVSCSGLQMRHRTNGQTVGMEVWAAELSCRREEWIDGVDGTKAPAVRSAWSPCESGRAREEEGDGLKGPGARDWTARRAAGAPPLVLGLGETPRPAPV